MFSEDADNDMFAATPVAGRAGAAQANKPRALADNFDDAEGYYNFQASIIVMPCALRMSSTVGWPCRGCCRLCVVADLTACLRLSRMHTHALQTPHWAHDQSVTAAVESCQPAVQGSLAVFWLAGSCAVLFAHFGAASSVDNLLKGSSVSVLLVGRPTGVTASKV